MGGSWSLAGLELAGQGFTSLLSHLALTLSRLPLAGYTLARPCLSPGSQSRSLLRPHLSARAAQEALWLTPSLGFLLSMPWFPHLHSRVHTHVAQGGGGGGKGMGPGLGGAPAGCRAFFYTGSPKRHHFQRQRAASESMEQEEGGAPQADFIQYIASAGDAVAFPSPHPFLTSPASSPPALGRLEAAEEVGAAGGSSPESPPERSSSSMGPEQQQDSDGERDAGPEQAQTIYCDIWSLRASLELHAATASDHSSSGNDRDSVRSGDSSGSGSGGTVPAFPPPSPPPTPRPAESEASGPRKLLQMDSGYASIEGRGAGDEGPPSAPEKRSSFTSAGHEATVGGSFEGPMPEVPSRPRSPRAWPRRAPRRDYSIDEKTDALFHEFLRHDPHFDDAPSAAARHRARVHPHTRKQWQQRGRQHSDPGARAAAPAPSGAPTGAPRPARAPLRRGDSVDCPPEGRAGEDPAALAIPVIEEEPGGGCPGSGLCTGPQGALLDKLAVSLDDRLFPPRLAQPVAVAPALAAAAPTSPDHSPV